MSAFLNRGQKAKESVNRKNVQVDFKKVHFKLKDGESARIRILSPEDYVEYMAHGSYTNGIYTTACMAHTGERCVFCEASNTKNEDFDDLYAKKRYLFAFYDLDEKMIRVFDASKTQAKTLIDTIEEYREELGEMAFTFKRTGNKMETNYSLNTITPKKMSAVQEAFDAAGEAMVEDDFFNTVIQTRPIEAQLDMLRKAGFPMETIGESSEMSPNANLATPMVEMQEDSADDVNLVELTDKELKDLFKKTDDEDEKRRLIEEASRRETEQKEAI
jgi:hypothetical protein